MAKTNRRPVDSLERKQRLAQRNRFERQDFVRASRRLFDLAIEDQDGPIEDYSYASETQAA